MRKLHLRKGITRELKPGETYAVKGFGPVKDHIIIKPTRKVHPYAYEVDILSPNGKRPLRGVIKECFLTFDPKPEKATIPYWLAVHFLFPRLTILSAQGKLYFPMLQLHAGPPNARELGKHAAYIYALSLHHGFYVTDLHAHNAGSRWYDAVLDMRDQPAENFLDSIVLRTDIRSLQSAHGTRFARDYLRSFKHWFKRFSKDPDQIRKYFATERRELRRLLRSRGYKVIKENYYPV